ncbi:MAG: linear amide C-N hydrolase [Candidatus Aminicenantes bacterium]
MKKVAAHILILLVFISLILTGPALEACSTFVLKSGTHLVFGRNYDWAIGHGLVIVNQRNLIKKSPPLADPSAKPIEWVSKYGSITFNQYGKEFPMGGMNEAGLVVEVMWLEGTVYPSPDGRPEFSELQWVQYQLDTASSVKEVIASDASLRISANSVPIHFLVSDKTGEAVTVEFLEGKMVYHTGETLPVKALTNSTYKDSIAYLKNHKGFGGERAIGFSGNSLDRFARAANMLAQYDPSKDKMIVDYAFSILDSVDNPEWTQWSIVYDVTNRVVYYKTKDAPQLKRFSFDDFDFECKSSSKVIDMQTDKTGDIGGYFIDYSTEINRELIDRSFKDTEFLQNTPEEVMDQRAHYPDSIYCRDKK